jgi:hypothetical protein
MTVTSADVRLKSAQQVPDGSGCSSKVERGVLDRAMLPN